MADKKRLTIGFLNNEIHRDWAVWPWQGMEDAARQHDVNLLTVVGKILRRMENFDEQANVLYALVDADRFDGLIIWASGQLRLLSESEREAFCRGFGVPVVTIEGRSQRVPLRHL